MNRPAIRLFRVLLRVRLLAKGYSRTQISDVMGKLGDGTILDWLRKYGPTILEVIKIILPFILSLFTSPPENPPVAEFDNDDVLFDDTVFTLDTDE